MIDFTATRAGASPQDRACANLLAAIIAGAVRDASRPLSADERREQVNLNYNARAALNYLFGPGDPFSAHARLIGSCADDIRRALLKPSDTEGVSWMHFPTERRLALQTRARLADHA